jgi:hypothetical protein
MIQEITNTPTQNESAPRGTGMLRPFKHTGFLIAAAVLLAAAVGLNASVGMLQLNFMKKPVPLRKSFTQAGAIPLVMGPWVQVAREEVLNKDMLASLATNEFLFCHYVDSRVYAKTPKEIQAMFANKDLNSQRQLLLQLQKENPRGVMQFYLTHYTGKADTVAHIPERCYVGSGFTPRDPGNENWSVGNRTLGVRHITFEHQTAIRQACDVAYFFHTNGRYESDSLRVRATLQNLFERYGYYTKIELMCGTGNRKVSQPVMQEFLTHALPALEEALPDWEQYKGKK